jgi:hypothetical protein
MGPILGAEFLVRVGDICAFESADRLASYAGLLPAARDSGKRVGNRGRMQGGTIPSSESSTSRPVPACGLHRSPEPSIRAQESRGQMLGDGTTFEERSAA